MSNRPYTAYLARRGLQIMRDAVTIALKPEQERIIQEQMVSGRFQSVEEVVDTALSTLAHQEDDQLKSGDEAVRRMIDFAETQSVKLPPGEKLKDFVHEGHQY